MSHRYDLVVLGGGIVGIWTARQAAARGARVALVEIGPSSLGDEAAPKPALRFSRRENLGATRARHHVLTGNSPYWGGGLCRNDCETLREMFSLESCAVATARLARHYDGIERTLGITPSLPSAQPQPLLEELTLSEIAVLPGKRRGLWSGFAEQVRRGRSAVTCLVASTISEVASDPLGQVNSVTVELSSGKVARLQAPLFALAMGVVDSNLFALRNLGGILSEEAKRYVGTRLHDHWSVPLARMRWKNGTPLSQLFPPKFYRGGIVGRRSCDSVGFFHFTANLDELPPYDRVKKFLSVRQKGETFGRQVRAALGTVGRPLLMARAGVHYLLERELYIPDGCEITLTFDFQSYASALNRIAIEGDEAVLDWDIRPQDIDAFGRTVSARRDSLCRALSSHGLEVEWLAGDGGSGASAEYLGKAAIDAFHLGGGLQVCGAANDGVVDSRFVVRGTTNLHVLGTANFRRPGLANPVLTLLAQSQQFVFEHFDQGAVQ